MVDISATVQNSTIVEHLQARDVGNSMRKLLLAPCSLRPRARRLRISFQCESDVPKDVAKLVAHASLTRRMLLFIGAHRGRTRNSGRARRILAFNAPNCVRRGLIQGPCSLCEGLAASNAQPRKVQPHSYGGRLLAWRNRKRCTHGGGRVNYCVVG